MVEKKKSVTEYVYMPVWCAGCPSINSPEYQAYYHFGSFNSD